MSNQVITLDEALRRYPDVFASDQVREMVAEVVQSGEAELWDTGADLLYHDPYFSDKNHPVRDLRYNGELGLHIQST